MENHGAVQWFSDSKEIVGEGKKHTHKRSKYFSLQSLKNKKIKKKIQESDRWCA